MDKQQDQNQDQDLDCDQDPDSEKPGLYDKDDYEILNSSQKFDRNYKDNVFRNLFGDRKYAWMLYKALHPEDTDTKPEDLEFLTLENVLVKDIYNDLCFLVSDKYLIFVEEQSTWSENIAFRCMGYADTTLKRYVRRSRQSTYREKRVVFPEPEFFVLYVGSQNIEDDEISFSKNFFGGKKIALDITVKVITDGREGDIINQYVNFAKFATEQVKKYGNTTDVLYDIIRICKERNILREYLTGRESEVVKEMFSLYDEREVLNEYMASLRKDVAEEVTEETWETASKTHAQSMYQEGVSIDAIARIVKRDINTVEQWIGLA